MKRALFSALTATVLIATAFTQDFGFGGAPGGPGGTALNGILNNGLSNRGVTGAGQNSELLGGFGSSGFGGVDVAAGDFNADGFPDVAVTSAGPDGGRVTIFSAEGDGTFGLPLSINVMNQPISIATGDIDMDGLADIIVGGVDYPSDPSGQLEVFSGANLSNGIPSNGPPLWLDGPPTSIAIDRLDGDAFADVAVGLGYGDGSGAVQVLMDNGGGAGGTMTFSGGGTNFMPVAPRDLDISSPSFAASRGSTDAEAEIAVATSGGVQLLDVDLASVPLNGLVQFRSSDQGGLGFFGQGGGSTAAGGSPVGVIAGDVNGDNVSDIIALNQGSGTVSTFVGSAGGGYQAPTTALAGSNPIDLSLMNFNNDSMPDIAVLNSGGPGGTGSVQILQGNGGGGFAPANTLPGSSWANVLAYGTASIFPPGQEPPNFNLGPGGSLNIITFCNVRPASCGGNGLSLPGAQAGVTSGTTGPQNALMIRGEHAPSRPFEMVRRLGRLLGGLLATGTPAPLASARYSVFATRQMRAQVEPAQVIITATGVSSGDFFKMEIIDRSGNVHRGMLPEGVVLEPVAAPTAAAPADANVVSQNVQGFCMDVAKDVPKAGTRYRIANAAAQAQASPIRNVLAASKQLAMNNLLHTDGTTGYINFVRQYAVWAKREGWDIKKFGESFVTKTKQNVLAMKANWTDVMEQGVRAAIPGRWRDIEEVLRLSNQIAAVPGK